MAARQETAGATRPEMSAGVRSGESTTQTSGNKGLGVILALLALYFIWGSTYLAISIAVQSFPPFLIGGLRFTIAGVVLFTVLRLRGEPMPTRAQWGAAAAVGLLLLVGGNGLVMFAEQWVASGLAALVIATVPLWAALFAGLWGRWPSGFEWVGLGLGFVGVVLLNLEGNMQANPLGTIAIFISPICWAFGSIWSTHLPMPKGMMSSAAEQLVAGVVFFILSFGLGEHMKGEPSAASLGALAYLIVFGSLVAFSAYVFLLARVRPTLATSYAYVNPVVAVMLGVGLVGEHITWIGITAMGIILSAVAVLTLARKGGK